VPHKPSAADATDADKAATDATSASDTVADAAVVVAAVLATLLWNGRSLEKKKQKKE
jgi:hypothetical protein